MANIREESNASSNQNWAMLFIGGALSSLLTYITLGSGADIAKALVISLIFCTSVMGIYFFFNWKSNKKKEVSLLKEKQKQLDELFAKIEKRIPSKVSTKNEKVIIPEMLELNQLS